MLGKFVLSAMLVLTSLNLMAAEHTGTISKMRGSVEVLSGGTKSVTGSGSHVKYNGLHYTLIKPSVGDKVKQGQIVRTGKRSLARIIFENGDQFIVGPGSEYSLSFRKKKIEESSLINLTRGKFRAIISKKGPRNKMKVETRNIAMGVRGTDFYVDARGHNRSEVSVIRGEVKLKEKPVEKIVNEMAKEIQVVRKSTVPQKEVTLKTGYSAAITVERKIENIVKTEKQAMKKDAKDVIETDFKVKRTTKEKLVSIQKNTVIKETEEERKIAAKNVDKKIQKKIETLEKKAVKVTLDDIKTHTPDIYEKIKKEETKLATAEQLSTQVVAEAFKEAPKEEKISADDLEDLGGEDAYEKYFKF